MDETGTVDDGGSGFAGLVWGAGGHLNPTTDGIKVQIVLLEIMSRRGISTDNKQLAAAADHRIRGQEICAVGEVKLRRATEIRKPGERARWVNRRGGHESIRTIKDQPRVHDYEAIECQDRRLPASTLAVAVPAFGGARIPITLEDYMGIAVCVADHMG